VYNAKSQTFLMAVSLYIKAVDEEFCNFTVQSQVHMEMQGFLHAMSYQLEIHSYGLRFLDAEDEGTMII
jgi:hypothetical protein